jgi:hypothetical protein
MTSSTIPAIAVSTTTTTTTTTPNTDAQSWQIWNKDVIPLIRDLLFLLAIFAYVIGFAHHAAKMSAFGMETQLADQPLDSLLNWAAESVHAGWPGFAIILIGVVLLLFLAEYLKSRLEHDERCRPVAYSIVTASMIIGLALTYSWSSHEGRCSAARFERGLAPQTSLTMFLTPGAHVPVLTDNPQAPPPVYMLGETDDMYQLLVTQPRTAGTSASLLSIAIPRSLVGSIEFRTIAEDANATFESATGAAATGLPKGIPTPDAAQRGPATPTTALAADQAPAPCWWIDQAP